MEEQTQTISIEDYIETMIPYNLMFTGEFNGNNFANLVEDINASNQNLRRDLYLMSEGGQGNLIAPMRTLIEENGINLIASSHICSSAFILFFTTVANKSILNDTFGMFHYPYRANSDLKPNESIRYYGGFDEFIHKKAKYDIDFMRELLKIDNKKHKELLNGGEIYYTDKQLRKLLKKSNKMLGISKN